MKQQLLASPEAEAAGLKIWLDGDDLVEGRPWPPQIEKAIGEATGFVLLVGARGIRDWVWAETDIAMSRAVKEKSFRFTPVLLEGAGSGALTPFAKRFHAVRDPFNDPEQMQRLLRAALGKEGETGLPILTSEPFPGLRSMDESWADRFFGRREETAQLIARLRTSPIIAIVADSGAGKSSLAMAGVATAWRGGAMREERPSVDDMEEWNVIRMRPFDNPLEELARATAGNAQALGRSATDQVAYADAIREAKPALAIQALECGSSAQHTRTLLVIDQAEELWTQTLDPKRRHTFGRLLASMIESGAASGRLRVLLTVRADYIESLTSIEGLGPLLTDKTAHFRLKLANGDKIAEMVRGPLRLAGHNDEAEQDRLVARVVEDVMNRDGDLALVQMALYLSWRDRLEQKSVLGAYDALGGVLGALGREARRVTQTKLDAGERAELMPLFVRLIRLGEAHMGATRRAAEKSEFDARQQCLIDRLASEGCSRLLQVRDSKVEISHEALITQWPELQAEVSDNQHEVRRLGDLMARARDWKEGGRNLGLLK